MWQLLKADLMYNKFIFIISYLLVVPFLVLCWEGMTGTVLEKARFILISLFVLAVLVIIIKNTTYSQEKRTRLFAELPIPPWQAGISRLLFLIFFWIGLLILFWMSKWILVPGDTTRDPVLFWVMLYVTGAVAIINGLYFMLSDLKYCFQPGPRYLNQKTKHINFPQILVCGIFTSLVIYLFGAFVLYVAYLLGYPAWSFASFSEASIGAFSHVFMIYVLAATSMFIYAAAIPTLGDRFKNIIITSLVVWIIGVMFIVAGTMPNLSIKAIINLAAILPQFFLGILAGAHVYRKGHTGLIPRVMVIIGCFLCVIFTWKIFTVMESGPVNPYFSKTLLNPAIILNAVGLGISYLGVLTFLGRRSYVK